MNFLKKINRRALVVGLAVFCLMLPAFSVLLMGSSVPPVPSAATGPVVTGVFIRREAVLDGDAPLAATFPQEGESVSSGSELCILAETENELRAAIRLRELRLELAAAGEEDVMPGRTFREAAAGLSASLASGDPDSARADIAIMASRMAGGTTEEKKAALRTELAGLAASAPVVGTLTANRAGLFSACCDGLEYLTPEYMLSLQAGDVNALREQGTREAKGVCRVVSAERWFFAAELTAEQARTQTVGESVVLLTADGTRLLVKTEDLRMAGDGRCLGIYSAESALGEILSRRFETVTILPYEPGPAEQLNNRLMG